MIIYGFVSDTLFHNKTTIDLGNAQQPVIGYMDELHDSYFHVRATISDPRPNRIPVLGPAATGTIQLLFDKSKVDSPCLFDAISSEVHAKLFNILERLYLSNATALEAVETDLRTSDMFSIYVPGSLYVATDTTPIDVFLAGSPSPTRIVVRDYVGFKVNVDGTVTEFKLWLNRDVFGEDYPLTTICKVVLPCAPEYLLDPSQLTSALDAIVKSSEYTYSVVDSDMQTVDHTGLMPFATKYVASATDVRLIHFGVLYQGSRPSSMLVRKAIRELLLSLGLAPQATWESRLPDLFVVAQFFLMPMWKNITVRPDRTMYPSILKAGELVRIAEAWQPEYEPLFLQDHLEVLTVGQSEIFLLALPDPVNEGGRFSLLQEHPTYQLHHAQEPAFSYMENKTREFNIRLNRCMAVLMGETVSSVTEFTPNTFDGRRYMSFVAHNIEYHVLEKASYPI